MDELTSTRRPLAARHEENDYGWRQTNSKRLRASRAASAFSASLRPAVRSDCWPPASTCGTAATSFPPSATSWRGSASSCCAGRRRRTSIRNAGAAAPIGARVSAMLGENVKDIEVVSPGEVDNWVDEQDWENFKDLGRAVKATRIVYIELDDFDLYKGKTLYQGTADMNITVYDMDGPRQADVSAPPGPGAVPAEQRHPGGRQAGAGSSSGSSSRSSRSRSPSTSTSTIRTRASRSTRWRTTKSCQPSALRRTGARRRPRYSGGGSRRGGPCGSASLGRGGRLLPLPSFSRRQIREAFVPPPAERRCQLPLGQHRPRRARVVVAHALRDRSSAFVGQLLQLLAANRSPGRRTQVLFRSLLEWHALLRLRRASCCSRRCAPWRPAHGPGPGRNPACHRGSLRSARSSSPASSVWQSRSSLGCSSAAARWARTAAGPTPPRRAWGTAAHVLHRRRPRHLRRLDQRAARPLFDCTSRMYSARGHVVGLVAAHRVGVEERREVGRQIARFRRRDTVAADDAVGMRREVQPARFVAQPRQRIRAEARVEQFSSSPPPAKRSLSDSGISDSGPSVHRHPLRPLVELAGRGRSTSHRPCRRPNGAGRPTT